ncbi:MAG: FemAB family protein [candidate division WS6 bacterium OLB20]|uniref:FemAB family protein n=1 Tax=candidate division WS6 bacterium OLB20 TaxID=1617426 RepID=A0A136LZJ1_9BACT|nr:MAG: FemAB family protein [candidate division WS6 bacterium OLB20]
MNITVGVITEKSVWEGFLGDSGLAHSFFQSWNWGQFERSLGKTIHYLGFYQLDSLLAVALVTEVDARRGRFLHVRNGPVLDWRQASMAKAILAELEQFARSVSCDYLRISPLVPPAGQQERLVRMSGFVDSQMHDVDAEITWMLDLRQPEEKILAEMRKNTRYYIRKAERDGVTIEVTTDPERIDDFWPIYQDTIRRQKWSAYSKEYIRSEFEQFVKDGSAALFLARYEDRWIAGAIFIYYNGQVYYHHSGSLTEYRKITAPYLLQWESIREAKRRGMDTYNFFGIARTDDETHPWHGLTFFKKGFGGYEQVWMHAKDKPLRLRYWITHLYERYERNRRGY